MAIEGIGEHSEVFYRPPEALIFVAHAIKRCLLAARPKS